MISFIYMIFILLDIVSYLINISKMPIQIKHIG